MKKYVNVYYSSNKMEYVQHVEITIAYKAYKQGQKVRKSIASNVLFSVNQIVFDLID